MTNKLPYLVNLIIQFNYQFKDPAARKQVILRSVYIKKDGANKISLQFWETGCLDVILRITFAALQKPCQERKFQEFGEVRF